MTDKAFFLLFSQTFVNAREPTHVMGILEGKIPTA